VVAALLLREPDFGAAVVITATTFGILFLAGVRLSQFVTLCALCVVIISVIAFSAPYRLLRLTTFLDPWANQFDSGYQLTQSLIAFGRGGWFGVGLGESVQKLFYLPEAHTDFLFAVLTEEFGLIGALLVVLCFAVLVTRAFMIGRCAYLSNRLFNAYVAYGIAFWIGIQAFINVGVNSGILPTKGLTLPLMSAGGSSMLIMCIAIAFLFRVDFENRQ
jgi:cell division protein FtsW